MSDTTPFGFGRFVPGFDFLQNLAKGAAAGMPAMPATLSGWVAPTLSVEELDKRIQELKAVQFWLEQNARALTATVQALEVQKMTLATLQGMNVAMGDMVGAMGAAARQAPEPKAQAQAQTWPGVSPSPAPADSPQPKASPKDAKAAPPDAAAAPDAGQAQPQAKAEGAAAGMVDPMQWWGALTNQFQQLAANAMKDATAQRAAFEATREMASGALKTATDMAAQMAAQGIQGAAAVAKQASAAVPKAAPKAAAKPAPEAPVQEPAKPRPAPRKSAGAAKKAAAPRAPR